MGPAIRRSAAAARSENAMSRIDDEALDWVARETAGHMTADDRAAFDAWFGKHPRHQGAYLRARAIAHSLDGVKVQPSLKPRVEEADMPAHALPSPGRRTLMIGGAMAAGLAAVAVASFGPDLFGRGVYETAQGEFRKVQLADRSVLSISSASRVTVRLSGAQRRLTLERGETWFEVAKDRERPFVVEVGDVRVRAVGTAFSVRRLEGGADVLVTEGVVEVWANQGTATRQRLGAGGLAHIPADGSAIRVVTDPAEVERRLAWREGKLRFQNEPLGSAVAEFNRYNTRQLVVADAALRRKPLVGQYRIDQPEEFANDVQALLNVPVAIEPDTIRIGASR
jgi:transmembrane sensor